MGCAERRQEILKILCRRRHETVANLAFELCVSERTVRRDIEALSLSEPIYTQAGRYGGGVYILDSYKPPNAYMAEQESSLLKKIYRIAEKMERGDLSYEEMTILKKIIEDHSKPIISPQD